MKALQEVSARRTKGEYDAKKRKILASADRRTETVSGGMIYCRWCRDPKIADFPDRNFIVRCSCRCEVRAWERDREAYEQKFRPKISEIKSGDWNPFEN